MKTKILVIIIIILLVIIGVLVFFLLGGDKLLTNNPPFSPEFLNKPIYTPTSDLSEQPDSAKFNEYFTNAWIGKLPVNTEFDPMAVVPAQTFSATDQFCTSLDIKKTIAKGSLSGAVYNVDTKEYVESKSVFPMELKQGNTLGCEPLTFVAGKYESKVYIDNILTIVLPFRIQ